MQQIRKEKINLKKIFGILLIVLAIILNPFLVNKYLTPSFADPLFNAVQIIFIEIFFLILGSFLYYNSKIKIKVSGIILLILTLLAGLILLENIVSRIFLICLFIIIGIAFIYKNNFFRKNKKELILLLVILLILFFSLEIFARVYLIKPKVLLPQHMYYIREFSKSGILKLSEIDKLKYELKSNLKTEFSLASFETNSEGLRDKEYSKIKPPNTYRIIILGDSTTASVGATNEENYHTLLENWYNNESSSVNYEFINLAVPGYSLTQYISLLKNKVFQYNPDHIIIGFLVANDFEMDYLKDLNFTLQKQRINSNFRWWGGKLIRDSVKNIIKRFKKEDRKEQELNLEKIDEIFKEFKNIADEKDIKLTVIALARKEEKENNPKEYQTLKEMSIKYNFDLIETAYKFENISYEETKIFRIDNHWDARTHALIAEAIKEQLNFA